jgi:hypothetical protein
MSKYVSSILTKKVKPGTTSFEAPEVFVCIEKTNQDEGMKQPWGIVLGESTIFLKAETVAIENKVSCCAKPMAYICVLH